MAYGREWYVLVRRNGKWRVARRALSKAFAHQIATDLCVCGYEARSARSKIRYWIDAEGTQRKVPDSSFRLRPHQIPGHIALRKFIFARDGHACKRCGATNELVLDHVTSWRNGGTHHPDNLQTLCNTCNAKKSNYEDRGRTPAGVVA